MSTLIYLSTLSSNYYTRVTLEQLVGLDRVGVLNKYMLFARFDGDLNSKLKLKEIIRIK